MKTRKYPFLFCTIIISAIIFSSCKSSFPSARTPVECKGKLVMPILNPTVRPVFPGEPQAMDQFLFKNVIIPQDVKIKGKVRVAFIVTKEGEICDVRVTSKPKEYIDNEIIRVIKSMPKWIPATNAGEIVDSYYLLDINF